MKGYKLFRGLLKAWAFASIMFVTQACYGAPQAPNWEDLEEDETTMVSDTLQEGEEDLVLETEQE